MLTKLIERAVNYLGMPEKREEAIGVSRWLIDKGLANVDDFVKSGSNLSQFIIKKATPKIGEMLGEISPEIPTDEDYRALLENGTDEAKKIAAQKFTNLGLAIGSVAPEVKLSKVGKVVVEEAGKVVKPVVGKVKQISGKVVSELEPLAQEAKKYKTVEEFVNSFSKQYHGSPKADLQEISFGTGIRSNPFLGTSKEVQSPSIFFSKDKNVADTFAKNRVEYLATKNEKGIPTVYERFINKKGILDLTKPQNVDKAFEKLKISTESELEGLVPNYGLGEDFSEALAGGRVEMGDLFKIFDDPKLVKKFKDEGYSGVRLIEKGGLGESTAIFDPKKAFSKSQLTDIWNQANLK